MSDAKHSGFTRSEPPPGPSGDAALAAENAALRQKLQEVQARLDELGQQTASALQDRLDFEALIMTLSTRFIGLPADHLAAGIRDALAALGRFAGGDCCFMRSLDEHGPPAVASHLWSADVTEQSRDRQRVSEVLASPYFATELLRRDLLSMPSPDALPPAATAERELCAQHGIKSLLAVALRSHGRCAGAVGMLATREERGWSDEVSWPMRLLAEMLTGALHRRRTEEQLKLSLREKEILLNETHHRVKNNLQIICSLLSLQQDRVQDAAALLMLRDSQSRVRSMGLIHEMLYRNKDLTQIDFRAYVLSLMKYLLQSYSLDIRDENIKIQVDVADISLNIDTAIPCGLIINELIANACKYAFCGRQYGRIAVALRRAPQHHLELLVSDDGIGLKETLDLSRTPSLGLQLVSRLAQQLGGQLLHVPGDGTTFCVTFPEGSHGS